MKKSIQNLISFSSVLSLLALASVTANAACAISIGKGEGKTQQIAERRAQTDARAKIGNMRPSTASFSDPACYVSDNFAKGIATYGCEVELSFCTNPKPPLENVLKKQYKHFGKKHRAKYNRFHASQHEWNRHHTGHGRIKFGGWRKTRTEVSCLRFNAKASGKNALQASNLVNGALIKSIAHNIGGGFQHANVEATGPSCSAVSSQKVTCVQTARYCF